MKYWKRQVRFEEEFGALSVEELEDIVQEEYANYSHCDDTGCCISFFYAFLRRKQHIILC